MASFIYDNWKFGQLSGASFIDFDGDTLKVMLTSSSYAPSQANDAFANAVTNEVSTSGYSAGGKALTSLSIVSDSSNHWTNVKASDIAWSIPSGSTLTARFAVIYKSLATLTLSPLVAVIDFGSDQTASNGNLTISWSTPGYLRLA